ncbi:9-O-acetylesterase, partial [Stenotrophomonas maltophilia]
MRDFSAACFYFARELQRTAAVPMGLIQAAWATLHGQRQPPTRVRDFSAACFYFARELQRTAAVPMGLIQAAW